MKNKEGVALTNRQRRFIEEYLLDCNATQAALRAGYSSSTACQMGSENLSKPVIGAEISRRQQKRSTLLELAGEDVTKLLKRLLDADIAEVFDARGRIKPVEDWPSEFRIHLVRRIQVRVEPKGQHESSRIISVEFANRGPLLHQLGRLLGVWK